MPQDKVEKDVAQKRVLEEAPASLSKPLPREKLPKDLQKIVDKEDDFFDALYDGQYGFHIIPHLTLTYLLFRS